MILIPPRDSLQVLNITCRERVAAMLELSDLPHSLIKGWAALWTKVEILSRSSSCWLWICILHFFNRISQTKGSNKWPQSKHRVVIMWKISQWILATAKLWRIPNSSLHRCKIKCRSDKPNVSVKVSPFFNKHIDHSRLFVSHTANCPQGVKKKNLLVPADQNHCLNCNTDLFSFYYE